VYVTAYAGLLKLSKQNVNLITKKNEQVMHVLVLYSADSAAFFFKVGLARTHINAILDIDF